MQRRTVYGVTGLLLGLLLLVAAGALPALAAPGSTTALPVVADFEGGVPGGWFQYGDNGTTVNAQVSTVPDTDPLALPGQIGANDILSVTANVPTWAGFGAGLSPVQDWSDYEAVSFWFYGENSGTEHEFEIQTAQNVDRRVKFTDSFTGWRQLVFPFTTFGAGGAYDVSQVDNWVFVLDGTVGSLKLDNIELVNIQPFADFEGAVPAGWFQYGDGGTVVNATVATIDVGDPMAVPGQVAANGVLSVTANVPTWAGFGAALNPTADWSDMQGVSFWFYGANSGTTHEFELQTAQDDDRRVSFVDNFSGWRLLAFPFTTFGATPYDVSQVDNWVFVLDGTVGSFALDHLSVYGDAGNIPVRVQFDPVAYTVTEGETATVTVKLNVASLVTVTVDYATADGTALAGTHYTATTGTLTFNAGDELTQSFTVSTINNDLYEGNRTLTLTLSAPANAELGLHAQATLTILEDELSNVCEVRSLLVNDFEDGNLPSGVDGDGLSLGFFTWVGPNATINITTTLQATNTVLQMNSNVPRGSWGGMTNHFTNAAVDSWVAQDWSTYEAISFWVYGTNSGEMLLFEVQDNRNPGSTVDDTQIWSYPFPDDFTGWKRFVVMFAEFDMKQIGNGAPVDDFGRDQVHGYAFGSTGLIGTTYLDDVQVCGTAADRPLSVAFEQAKTSANEGELAALTVKLNKPYTETVTVQYTTAQATARVGEQYTPVSGTLTFLAGTVTQTVSIPTHHDGKHTRDTRVAVNLYEGAGAPLGFQRRSVLTIVDIDPAAPRLVDDFQGAHPFIYQDGTVGLSITTVMTGNMMAMPGQGTYEDVLTVAYDGASSFSRIFSPGQDWSGYDGVSFWFYGQNTGNTITYQLRDNMAVTTAVVAPADWALVWSDEFNGPAGTPPNRNVWKHELGDGALNEIVGWGNSERQFYTDSTENSFMDGNGNLVIRLQDTPNDTALVCWYGPCEYTSARLLTQDQLEFEYGRIEARVQVPNGPGGLWPAFWMLGADIPEVGWPQSGEIDIMEYVSRLPYEVFGTIHGPGYSGGDSFGDIHTFTQTVPSKGYLTYGVEWTPNQIIWYVDDIRYHQAIPANVAPNEWVFNHPFFLLLNAAIGGNFGSAIADGMTFPQDTLVDYVRVYQAADSAERFSASFVDNFTGWKQIAVPFASFTRNAAQPAGAPNDGLTLTEVNGYGFRFPAATDQNRAGQAIITTHIDQVQLETQIDTPTALDEIDEPPASMKAPMYLPLVVR